MNNDRNIPQEVKEKIDIVEIVDRYVKLKKAGKNFSGPCPFHNEKTPSFIVSPDIQRYKCFGCGKSGDVITFIQEIETLDFREALIKLANEAGVEYTYSKKSSEITKLEQINEEAATFFESQLQNNQAAKQYLQKRGFTVDTLKKYRVGYSPGFNNLSKYVLRKGFKKDIMQKSGLFSDKNNSLNDRFIKRVMFPLWSPYGKIIGFSGRNLPGDDFGPKYLNTPETKLFQKRNNLFGLFQSKAHIKKENLSIMTEGQIDVISAYSANIFNVVAPLGTALTDEQLILLKKYSNRILFIFDDDTAGQRALERAFLIGSKEGMLMYAANPSPHQDLDELIQNDKTALKTIVKPKMDAYTYLIVRKLSGSSSHDLDTASEISRYHAELTENVADQVILKYYTEKFNKITGRVGEARIESQPRTRTTGKPHHVSPEKNDRLSQEEYFISLAVKHDLVPNLQKVNSKYFISPQIRQIIDIAKSEGCFSVESILLSVDISRETAKTLERSVFLQDKMPKVDQPEKELNEIYINIQILYWRARLENVRGQLAISEEEGDNSKSRELAEDTIKITSKIRTLNEQISKL